MLPARRPAPTSTPTAICQPCRSASISATKSATHAVVRATRPVKPESIGCSILAVFVILNSSRVGFHSSVTGLALTLALQFGVVLAICGPNSAEHLPEPCKHSQQREYRSAPRRLVNSVQPVSKPGADHHRERQRHPGCGEPDRRAQGSPGAFYFPPFAIIIQAARSNASCSACTERCASGRLTRHDTEPTESAICRT